MTRVNLIPVEELSDSHLLSEHREIKRIPNCIIKGKYNLVSTPYYYTMGKGHVAFFYMKQLFLYNRYLKLYEECIKRDFKVQDYSSCFKEVPSNLWNNWKPTEQDIRVSRTRIAEKIFRKDICQQRHYYKWSNVVTKKLKATSI